MELSLFLQGIVNGVMLGVFYALIALGLSLIFGIMGIINFSHGQMYMLGGFAVYYLFSQLHLNYFAALILTMVLVGFIGAVFERIIFRPLGKEELNAFIASLGLAWILEMLAAIIFGPLDKNVPNPFKGVIHVIGVVFTIQRLLTVLIGVGLVVSLYLFLMKSKTGKAIRAVAQNREVATLQGIDAGRVSTLSFAIGCALAGAAGVLMTPAFVINPFIGSEIILKCFVVIILGGMGSIMCALAGLLILGFIEGFGCLLFTIPVVTLITFIFIILILLFRPQGLLGHG